MGWRNRCQRRRCAAGKKGLPSLLSLRRRQSELRWSNSRSCSVQDALGQGARRVGRHHDLYRILRRNQVNNARQIRDEHRDTKLHRLCHGVRRNIQERWHYRQFCRCIWRWRKVVKGCLSAQSGFHFHFQTFPLSHCPSNISICRCGVAASISCIAIITIIVNIITIIIIIVTIKS